MTPLLFFCCLLITQCLRSSDVIIELPIETILKSKLLGGGFEGIAFETDLIKKIADKKMPAKKVVDEITHSLLQYSRTHPSPPTIDVLCDKKDRLINLIFIACQDKIITHQ